MLLSDDKTPAVEPLPALHLKPPRYRPYLGEGQLSVNCHIQAILNLMQQWLLLAVGLCTHES